MGPIIGAGGLVARPDDWWQTRPDETRPDEYPTHMLAASRRQTRSRKCDRVRLGLQLASW